MYARKARASAARGAGGGGPARGTGSTWAVRPSGTPSNSCASFTARNGVEDQLLAASSTAPARAAIKRQIGGSAAQPWRDPASGRPRDAVRTRSRRQRASAAVDGVPPAQAAATARLVRGRRARSSVDLFQVPARRPRARSAAAVVARRAFGAAPQIRAPNARRLRAKKGTHSRRTAPFDSSPCEGGERRRGRRRGARSLPPLAVGPAPWIFCVGRRPRG